MAGNPSATLCSSSEGGSQGGFHLVPPQACGLGWAVGGTKLPFLGTSLALLNLSWMELRALGGHKGAQGAPQGWEGGERETRHPLAWCGLLRPLGLAPALSGLPVAGHLVVGSCGNAVVNTPDDLSP